MAWFRRFTCLHREFSKWHVVPRFLYTPMFGATRDEVQQRECLACGHVQRRKIEETKMNILMEKLHRCPACGSDLDVDASRDLVKVQACSQECVRSSTSHFVNRTTYSTNVNPTNAHLHVGCTTCRFEWLERVHQMELVKEAW